MPTRAVPVRAVLFDVDDTLIDYSAAERAGIQCYLTDLGAPAELLESGARHWHELMERHFHRYLAGELDYLAQRRARAHDMLRWLEPWASQPARSSQSELDQWFDGYRQRYERSLTTFDDVPACLEALSDGRPAQARSGRRRGERPSGVRLGVVSNNDAAYQRQKLAQVGLLDHFSCVVGVDTAGCRKPEAGIFLTGCQALGLAAGETAYVGDRWDVDALGAAAAGLTGVWLDRQAHGDRPGQVPGGVTHRIAGLADLPAVLGLARPV